jgi:hypothetical protein
MGRCVVGTDLKSVPISRNEGHKGFPEKREAKGSRDDFVKQGNSIDSMQYDCFSKQIYRLMLAIPLVYTVIP